MRVVGVDPGIAGALALGVFDDSPSSVFVFDIPTHQVKIGRGLKRRVDLPGLLALVQAIASLGVDAAFLESVGGMPGQSASAGFEFGFAAGALRMAFVGAQVPIWTVTPAVWKKAMSVKSDKDDARLIAGQIFPTASASFARVKDHNRAEAALIARYGYQKLCDQTSTHTRMSAEDGLPPEDLVCSQMSQDLESQLRLL